MSNKTALYDEARRCADAASRGVTPDHRNYFSQLAVFYTALAKSEPELTAMPNSPPAGLDGNLSRVRDSRFDRPFDEPLPPRLPSIRGH
jgi:hypothetical protein